MQWNETFWQTPKCRKAPAYFDYRGDVKPIFYDCGVWKGKPVKAFAWIGFPKNLKKGQQVPGVVLVHGGGGTAFPDWVRLWNERGYAAIAMDNCGGLPVWNETSYGTNPWPRHAFSGPSGWGNFGEIGVLPPEDQWVYQATATVIAAHSLLRSFPQVDAGRIGITGVSWGGVLTCIAAGVDDRFAFAAPVYGCGFLDVTVFGEIEQIKDHPEKAEEWKRRWDPSCYLPQAKIPFLWVDGTNDFAFPLSIVTKSLQTMPGKSWRCWPVRMPHGHGGVSEKPEEIHNFADTVTGHGASLPMADFTAPVMDQGRLSVGFTAPWPIWKAEFNYTCDGGVEKERNWNIVAGGIDFAQGRLTAVLPEGATEGYFNLFSETGLLFSSPLWTA